MYNVSEAYKRQLKKQEQLKRIKGTINGVQFTGDDIISGSFNINNQISEVNEVKIGSVYIGQLSMTLIPDITFESWDKLQINVSEELYIEETDTWESVPLGVFYVDDASDTDFGTAIVAYDIMDKFNKTCDVDITTGFPYDLLIMACTKCGVTLGVTRSEVENFANGTEALILYGDNDIETWQDYLYWLAQTLCCVATSSRLGTLILREYNQNIVDDIDDDTRFSGSVFSKYTTRYSGLSVYNIEEKKTEYIGNEPDYYLTYNLGSNPFIQQGTSARKETLLRNILNKLLLIQYVPFDTKVLSGALYDLGDVVSFSRGIARGGMSCIMYYNYTTSEYDISGYGANPALASAKNKTDKNLAGLANNIKNKDFIFYVYENAEAYNVSDGSSVDIIDIRFTSASAMYVIFQAEVLIEIDTTVIGDTYDDAVATVSYILNSSEIEYFHPTETYVDGKHILHLANVFSIDVNAVNRLVVTLNLDGGDALIPAQAIRAAIYGQGLAASDEWDGFLDFSENIGEITFTNISVDTISDNVIFDIQDPLWQSMTERVSEITFDNMILETISENLTAYITEHAYINADNIPLYDDTAVEYSEGAYRIIEDADTPQELIKQLFDVGELVDITSITVDGSNITLQFGDDGLSWYSYINSNWIETSTEMTVNQAAALTIDDWIKLTSTSLWIKVSLNVANSYLAELEIEYIEGVSEE